MNEVSNVSKPAPKGKVNFNLTLSEEQKIAKGIILSTPYNFVIGKAGSGKTLLAVQIALDMFFTRKVNNIIITRPTVSDEDNGFLPGTLEDKMEPWLIPMRSNMRKVYNKPEKLESMERDKVIELVSLTHFRGRTFDHSIVIIDEFQNITKSQLRMAVGRLGKNSLMIFTGDVAQIDLKYVNDSAVNDLCKLEKSKYVSQILLKDNHRHPSMTEVLDLLYQQTSNK